MSGAVILIIEDDVHIGGLVAQVLREAGHAPALVRDVRAAQTWVAEGNRPAAVLSDLMVAGSAGPDRLPAELAAIFPGAPVALMTGVPPRPPGRVGGDARADPGEAIRAGDAHRPGEHDAAPPRRRGAVKIFPGRPPSPSRAAEPSGAADDARARGRHRQLRRRAPRAPGAAARGAGAGAPQRRTVGGADLRASPSAAVRAREGAAAHHVARAPAGAVRRGGNRRRDRRAFTPAFAAIEADEFVRRVLAQDLAAGDVVVGYDFSFGRGRAGNVARLAALGAELGLGVAVIPPVTVDGIPCSSTRVRELCAEGGRSGGPPRCSRPTGRDRGARRAGRGARSGARIPDRQRRPGGRAGARSSASTRRGPAPRRPGGWRGARPRAQRRPKPDVHRSRDRCARHRRGLPARLRRRSLRSPRCVSRSATACVTSNASSRSMR